MSHNFHLEKYDFPVPRKLVGILIQILMYGLTAPLWIL
jgi:hypothetical protein